MPKMTFTSPRATYDELLAFANAVREAGGGNPLDALMPAVPQDPHQCLIAKNLNFNCQVGGWDYLDEHLDDENPTWVMRVADTEIRHRIASALGLTLREDRPSDEQLAQYPHLQDEAEDWEQVIVLPPEIGQVAHDFDHWRDAFRTVWDSPTIGSYTYQIDTASDDEIERLRAFWPYVDASVKEAYVNASFINDKGELIL